MSATTIPLEHLLAQREEITPNLDHMNVDVLKTAVRFWFGATASNKYRKAECISALANLFLNRKRVEEGVRSLPENQRQVLAVFKRYGGTAAGPLLMSELLTRGLVVKPPNRVDAYNRRRNADPVHDLCAKLILVPRDGGISRYELGYSSYRLHYPDLFAARGVLDGVEPAPPLPWRPSAPASPPTGTSQRSAAEVALDLWTTAQALHQAGPWKTNRGGSLARSVQNRLRKLFSWPKEDPLLPPDPEALYYEILRGLGAVHVDENSGRVDLPAVERCLRSPGPVQAWHWVRAWLEARLWQDGVGVVSDRDSYDNPVRIDPKELRTARELLVWALCRAAHGGDEWLDLETFLVDLWSVTGEETIHFYWHGYTWTPEFKLSRGKANLSIEEGRRRAYWLDDVGVWAANAVLGTLAHLGLVERGDGASGRNDRLCFRLTPIGKTVFGAPDLAATAPEPVAKFLIVQPNYEVVVYLNVADASAVWPLAQMARRVSSAAGLVQTFALSRESVYQALESGLRVDEIVRFLREHSNTGLPDNVAHSLAEWGQRREAMVLRTGVTLAAHLSDQADRLPDASRGRRVGDHFVLLPKATARAVKGVPVYDHGNRPVSLWEINEEGVVHVGKDADAVVLARLGQFADPVDDEWKITAASIRRAWDRGIPAEQLLGWLHDHLVHELPALVETAIRNWSSPARIFFGGLTMLQVPQPQACAMILASRRFRPLLLGHIPPNWFVVRPDKQGELERLLAELGFSVGESCKLTELAEAAAERAAERLSGPGQKVRKGRRARPKG